MTAARRAAGPPPSRMKPLLLLLAGSVVLAFLAWPKEEPKAARPSRPGAAGVDPEAAGAPAPRRGGRAPAKAVVSPDEIPPLAEGLRGDLTQKVARNVFRFYDRPTPVPTPTPIPPTPVPMAAYQWEPKPLTKTPTPTPIVAPAVPYKAVGFFGPREEPIVALEDGGRLISAREGDTLDNKFVVKKINRESVDFGFVGFPPEITRRVALTGAELGR